MPYLVIDIYLSNFQKSSTKVEQLQSCIVDDVTSLANLRPLASYLLTSAS